MWKKIIANRFKRLYIQYGKIDWQIVLKKYIYIDWQKILANLFLDYIYNVAKDIGKSSEIHTDNYRQL